MQRKDAALHPQPVPFIKLLVESFLAGSDEFSFINAVAQHFFTALQDLGDVIKKPEHRVASLEDPHLKNIAAQSHTWAGGEFHPRRFHRILKFAQRLRARAHHPSFRLINGRL